MESDKIELAERPLNSSRWHWMPGMSTSNGGRVFAVDEDGSCRLDFGAEEVPFWCTPETMSKMTPCFTDPATLGCLLALVREAWGNPHIWVESCVDREMWSSIDHYKLGWACPNGEPVPPDIECATEAEALVAALEAAP
jgi:hypothetical protein